MSRTLPEKPGAAGDKKIFGKDVEKSGSDLAVVSNELKNTVYENS
jgi:energy-converting hydrogenase Eha subunit B